MLFSTVSDPLITADQLNHDLQVISIWATQWKMSFNPDPNKQAIEVLFSTKNKKINHSPLFLTTPLFQNLLRISILDLPWILTYHFLSILMKR